MLKINPETIDATTETALQRAIFNQKSTHLQEIGDVEWLGFEIPINDQAYRDAHGGRTSCFDLIGKTKKGKYVLVELKFHNFNKENCPAKAENELLTYYNTIKQNWKTLKEEETYRPDGYIDWEKLAKEEPILIVAADATYWVNWLGHRQFEKPTKTLCYSIDVASDLFEIQKGDNESFVPHIGTNDWIIIK